MEAASAIAANKRTQRLNDEELWSANAAALINILWGEAEAANSSGCRLSERTGGAASFEIPCSSFKDCMRTPEAREALLNLDIAEEDHAHLDDILDPDNGGSIGVFEFVEGVERLRGDPRRSDIITVDLMLRSVQRSL